MEIQSFNFEDLNVMMHGHRTHEDEGAITSGLKQIDRPDHVALHVRDQIALAQCLPVEAVVDDRVDAFEQFITSPVLVVRTDHQSVDPGFEVIGATGRSDQTLHLVPGKGRLSGDLRTNESAGSSQGNSHVWRLGRAGHFDQPTIDSALSIS